MNVKIIKRIHELIETKSTGSPSDLALKLNLTERSVYNYISFMKTDLNAPVKYDYEIMNYIYERECSLNFEG